MWHCLPRRLDSFATRSITANQRHSSNSSDHASSGAMIQVSQQHAQKHALQGSGENDRCSTCVRKWSLNERLRRGGRKQRLGLEAPNYLVMGIRESVLEETTVTPLRPGLIGALLLVGLALRPPEPLSSRATRLGNDTLQPVVYPAPDVSVVRRTPQ